MPVNYKCRREKLFDGNLTHYEHAWHGWLTWRKRERWRVIKTSFHRNTRGGDKIKTWCIFLNRHIHSIVHWDITPYPVFGRIWRTSRTADRGLSDLIFYSFFHNSSSILRIYVHYDHRTGFRCCATDERDCGSQNTRIFSIFAHFTVYIRAIIKSLYTTIYTWYILNIDNRRSSLYHLCIKIRLDVHRFLTYILSLDRPKLSKLSIEVLTLPFFEAVSRQTLQDASAAKTELFCRFWASSSNPVKFCIAIKHYSCFIQLRSSSTYYIRVRDMVVINHLYD